MENTELLKYPIGKFKAKTEVSIPECIESIESLPVKIRDATRKLSEIQLNTAYRPGGWALKQVVHHLPDSHMNAYIRFKLAMTEANPVILPYDEKAWAECEDAKNVHIDNSLDLLESLHTRWVQFLKVLNERDFRRSYFHPEHRRNFELKEVIQLYAWHGEHHLQHIIQTSKRNRW